MRTLVVVRICSIGMAALLMVSPLRAQDNRASANPSTVPGTGRFVEIRSYNLKPGRCDRFHRTFLTAALPMLERWKVDVVAYGPSLHDADSYYLMRAYPRVEPRQRRRSEEHTSEL